MNNPLLFLHLVFLLSVSLNLHSQQLSIPFHLSSNNDIILDGYEMKGEKLNFYYDSGTVGNTLSQSAATRLGFIYSGDSITYKTLGGRQFPIYYFTGFHIDPFWGLFASASTDNFLETVAGEKVDAIVGYTPSLEKYMLELDFEESKLRFWDSIPDFYTTNAQIKSIPLVQPDFGAENKISKYYGMNDFCIKGTVTIADSIISTTFVLDSGSYGYLNYYFFDSDLFTKAIDYKRKVSEKSGDDYPTTKLSIPELGIDSLMTSVRSFTMFDENELYRQHFGSRDIGCYLGIDFFLQYKKILFDWKNKIAYFYKDN